MNRESTHLNLSKLLLLPGAVGLLFISLANAQVPVDEDGNPVTSIGNTEILATDDGQEVPLLTAAELETLVGPVALYPDDLLAIVLPASTFPLEIVQAARFLERHEVDSTLKPDENWDESIIALLNYPEVVKMMSDDLDWTWKLGEAVVAQQSELVTAVEAFRDRAYTAGNLKTDEYQTVSDDDGIIEIEPVNDDVIYVPYYEPERVVEYSRRPVYNYYPQPYPVYNYPYAADHYFGSSFFWGVTTAFTIGWASDYLHVYHHSYSGHPYYGHTYYYGNHYWRRPSIHAYNNYYVNNHYRRSHDHYRHGDYWRPRHHGGARPGHQVARNSYYNGGRHSNAQTPSYRDRRTSGLNYNSNGRTTHVTTGTNSISRNGSFRTSRRSNASRQVNNGHSNRVVAANRNLTRTTNSSPRASTPRPSVQFRDRGNNAVTGTVTRRLERGPGNISRQSTDRVANARRNLRPDNSDRIRFRARESSANRNTTARQTRRPDNAVRTSATRRNSFVANNSSRRGQSTARRAQPTSNAPTVRRSSQAARVSAPARQATVRSQPRRESSSRPASPPRQSQQSAPSRSDSSPRQSSRQKSSRQKSSGRSQRSSRSSRDSGGQRRSSRKRK